MVSLRVHGPAARSAREQPPGHGLRAMVPTNRREVSEDLALGNRPGSRRRSSTPCLARSTYATRLFNLTITNVPGPHAPLYALGAPLRQVYPIVPLAAEHAVGVAIFSYDGLVTFGVIADSESTPDIAGLAEGIQPGLAELSALVPRARAEHLDTIELART